MQQSVLSGGRPGPPVEERRGGGGMSRRRTGIGEKCKRTGYAAITEFRSLAGIAARWRYRFSVTRPLTAEHALLRGRIGSRTTPSRRIARIWRPHSAPAGRNSSGWPLSPSKRRCLVAKAADRPEPSERRVPVFGEPTSAWASRRPSDFSSCINRSFFRTF